MKKLLFLLPILLLSACTSNQPSSSADLSKDVSVAKETDKTQRYEFSLTKDNLWYFIDSSNTVTSGNYYSCVYTFAGVLSYAYYDNVIIHLDYEIVGQGGIYPTGTYKADIEVKLNAAGCGGVSLAYDYIPANITPAYNDTSFYGCNRSLSIKSVSGIVRFSI